MKKQKVVVIAGPTASGKSDLGVALAKKFNGEIVSADSRQVYGGLDIGSGKITEKEMRGIPHHLLDVASPKRRFTVAQYRIKARAAIEEIIARGRIPFLVGGSGFYIQAVIDNITIPAVPPSPALRKALEKKSAEELFEELRARDPARAKALLQSAGQEKNKRRVIRALEIIYATGESVPSARLRAKSPYDLLIVGITYDRETLHRRIARRLTKRFEEGMIGEIKRLHDNGVSWRRLEELGLEYRWIARYVQGKVSQDEMKERLQKDIEHFAARQMTWWRSDSRVHWIHNQEEAEELVLGFLS